MGNSASSHYELGNLGTPVVMVRRQEVSMQQRREARQHREHTLDRADRRSRPGAAGKKDIITGIITGGETPPQLTLPSST